MPTFQGHVNHVDLWVPDFPERWAACLRAHAGHRIAVQVERHRERRTLQANRFYFGCVIRTIARELGYADPEELHEILGHKFRPMGPDPITGAPRRERTSRMSVEQFSKYIEDVITWAETDMGIRIPRPDEVED